MRSLDKVTGCIVGGAIGDALGGPYEGAVPPVEINDARPWRLSDDTQLTLATCEAIANNGGLVFPSAIAESFASWHRERRVTGMGASTYKALTELAQGGHWALVGRKGEYAAGSGAAMRVAPLAFCLDPTNSNDRQKIRDVARITHHNDEAYAGALAVVIAVRAAANGTWRGQPDLLRIVIEPMPDSKLRDRLVELSRLSPNLPLLEIATEYGCSGYVVEAVPLAFYGAQQIANLGFEALLRGFVAVGGDTDTISSIGGQIAGSLLGRQHLPAHMVARVPDLTQIERVAFDFARNFKREEAPESM